MPGSLKGLIWALFAFALFSSHDALIKKLNKHYSIFQIIFFAMLFAFVPMSMMMLADRSVGTFLPKRPGIVIARALLMIIAMVSGFYAFTVLPLAEVYALLFAMPLLITVLSVPVLGERVGFRRWAAVIVGLLGVLIVLRPGATALSIGHIAALTAAFANALATVLIRKIGGQERPAVLILYPMIAAMIAMSVALPTVYQPLEFAHLAIAALIGFLSVVAQLFTIYAYKASSAAIIAPVQYSQILWATLFGIVFFDEIPDIYVGIGSAVVISSGLFVLWRESQDNVSDQRPVLKTANPRFDIGPQPKRSD